MERDPVRKTLESEQEIMMDWSGCSLVETKPGVQRAARAEGARMPADHIIENWEAGFDEPDIAENDHCPGIEHNIL